MNEAGTRVPFLVRWPDKAIKVDKVDALVDFSDILPTFAEVAGADIPASHKIDGKSFLPLISGKRKQIRKWVFCQQGEDWFLRTKEFRLYMDGTFEYMKTHYSPQKADVQGNKETARKREYLQKVAKSLGIQ